MSSSVSVPIIPGVSYVKIKDPDITSTSRIEIIRSTADTKHASVSKQAQGHCTVTFKEPTRQNQYLRYRVRNTAGPA